ncbi:H+/gluconate symporter-like permease [Catenuloplanes nepalensis]|uniref:H+/gluconate symporter-like permease n=1 Tax=Catenuloplanes nepalensis TaxID=587533 RepID=A0ABT9MQZ3_9ACTN|nr:hypothetical protein [Catenuloplanes nepalensis]MDP9793840.1 H+/gluconate symporter-like permease [Catenuloplanes nepalensis]
MADVPATILADGPGDTYIGLVFMSGLCLAPMIMLGLGAWSASGSRRGRRVAVGISVVIVLFYGLSVLGSHFSWPDLRFNGEVADAAMLVLIACGGFLLLPWLLAFGVAKLVTRATPAPEPAPGPGSGSGSDPA